MTYYLSYTINTMCWSGAPLNSGGGDGVGMGRVGGWVGLDGSSWVAV